MKNKNLSVLLLAAISIMATSCGPGTQNTTITTATKTTIDSPAVSPPVATPATSFMSTSVYIYFGNPPDVALPKKERPSHIKGFGTSSQNKDDSTGNGGTCDGKGICLPSAIPFPKATLVTFTISEDNPYALVMTFSMKDLLKNQQDQYKYFSDPSGRYMFDGNFDLRLLFCPGLLPPGAMITPKSPSKLTLNKDVMTDVINYDHK